MKRLITTSVILFFAFCAYAQDTNKTITLHEITVKAAKVVNRPDGMTTHRCSKASIEQWLQHS